MRHAKKTFKVGRTGSHKRCTIANMLKSLIDKGRIETTITKAKELRRHADKMITLAKKDDIAARRLVRSRLMLQYNPLTAKNKRQVKQGNLSSYNCDRQILNKLFGELKTRFANRNGGYTRIIRTNHQVGDSAPKCFIEYLQQ